MEAVIDTVYGFVSQYLVMPKFTITDGIEILIIAVLIYQILSWIKTTRAWTLMKGIVILLAFVLMATFLKLNTILWIADKTFNVGVIAIIIVFHPELRKALEQLGRRQFLNDFFEKEHVDEDGIISDRTINELVRAVFEMAKQKTGALIVIQRQESLSEYERTGIVVDAAVSSQLLINIFEHNTPLHDGAVIIKDDRIACATCYLPLSDNMKISKGFGTRHRAALGVSEYTDGFTIIVSEETGRVSVTQSGVLIHNLDGEKLRAYLIEVQNKKAKKNSSFRNLFTKKEKSSGKSPKAKEVASSDEK